MLRASRQSPTGIQLAGCSGADGGPTLCAVDLVRDLKGSGRTRSCLFLKALFQFLREMLKRTNKIIMIISQTKATLITEINTMIFNLIRT
jgi:hypothetical protein